ncbi:MULTISPECIES: sensor domain-containing diguanylate cyclase [unclassified Halomonas]|uniref:sensor domain-containing diguanylate cyclase n=1 Tax=unclassified Halomonas TaxID=2609666 RepID=UPI002884778F|nr:MULTISPECIES: sensor domain-containing diguanylate cyclase [unclassified Halomonas]MDT0500155.1 sensor domain-containing diguanylate cyclase [Halomonas sp. PAR7]MDT0511352.1 sensor domain-containing diguanylate cyclase [Halomonas sp. LES1]MDT0590360.1 sensor domain-containing diguanylate cyclase [Halomonas sp. PAR8]
MTSTAVMPDGRVFDTALIEQLPGVIFQLHRSHAGKLHFPYLAGAGIRLIGIAPERLTLDARPALERLSDDDYPRLMTALERSMRWQSPLNTRFRLRLKQRGLRWIALHARPTPSEDGVLWHGMMMDISEQVAEEARLRRLSDTDDLTGLANRRRLMTRLDEAVSLSNRHATPLSLMILDIDHFKSVNDTYGHLQGDEVLRRVARLCHDSLREEDLVARLGGEEFALLLPLTPRHQALALAERLCRIIAKHDFDLAHPVTVSIGVAEHRVGADRRQLLERADRQLYVAKDKGRNQAMAET